MTDELVFDTNIIVKLIIPEEDSDLARSLYLESVNRNCEFYFPDYYRIESAQALWVKINRKLITVEDAQTAFDKLLHFPITIHPTDQLLPHAFTLANQYGIAVYDALFVSTVINLNCRGITADEKLLSKIEKSFPQILRLKDWK